jgi:hypothetical protein
MSVFDLSEFWEQFDGLEARQHRSISWKKFGFHDKRNKPLHCAALKSGLRSRNDVELLPFSVRV